jgi:hypothetical protein
MASVVVSAKEMRGAGLTNVVCQMTFGGGWHGHLFPARSWPQLEWALLSRRPFYSQGKSGAVACPFRFRTGGLWASFGHHLSLKRSFLVYATMLGWVSSCDAPILSGFQLACCAATGDVMIFSTAGPGHTLAAAKRLDTGMDGIQKKAAKDINGTRSFFWRCLWQGASLLQWDCYTSLTDGRSRLSSCNRFWVCYNG